MSLPWRPDGTTRLAVLALLLIPPFMPSASAAPPNSGTVMEGAKPLAEQEGGETVLDVEERQPEKPAEAGRRAILVKGFRLGGEPPLPENDLLRLVNGEIGRELTPGRLDELADELGKYMQQKGYLAASARISAKKSEDGVVEIVVLPGRYGKIEIRNHSHIGSYRIEAMLFAVKPGMIVTNDALMRALRLISDLSGADINARLKKGEEAGAGDLFLEIADDTKAGVQLYTDNWGNHYTGR